MRIYTPDVLFDATTASREGYWFVSPEMTVQYVPRACPIRFNGSIPPRWNSQATHQFSTIIREKQTVKTTGEDCLHPLRKGVVTVHFTQNKVVEKITGVENQVK